MSSTAHNTCIILVILGLCGGITGLDDQLKNHNKWKLVPGLSTCGKSKVNERIIGGSSAKLGQYPWIASLFRKNGKDIEFICGGSLINENHVLTAAHCIDAGLNLVRLGEHDLEMMVDCDGSLCAPIHTEYRISKAIRHPRYRQISLKHDIALIKITGRVTFHKFIQPICLPQGRLLSSYRLNGTVIVAGWGSTDPYPANKIYPSKLQHVSLPVVALKQCEGMFSLAVDEDQYCVGEKNKDSCVGDSGGPMMKSLVNGSSRNYFLFGLVSYGPSTCGDQPAVYTNIPRHMKWILDTISP